MCLVTSFRYLSSTSRTRASASNFLPLTEFAIAVATPKVD